jgi:glycosyltransferase involved in cell wall biosynthesis
MRIGLDVRYLSHGLVGGVHRYILHLVPALIQAGAQHTFYLYADTKRPFELTGLPDHVTVRLLPYRNALSSIYHDWFMRRTMAADRLDVVHFPANYGFGPPGARTILTLHDQINILPLREIIRGHRKQARTIAMMTYLHFCTTSALRRAHYVITVSNYSRDRILENSHFDPERIVAWIYAPSPNLRRIEDPTALADVRQRHGLEKPFVLADGVKNPAALVNAWKQLPDDLRQQHQIVFFSRIPTPPEAVFEAQAAGYARLLVRPSDADLMALYSMAQAFVFPSWIEGLGLPLLEAMTCGAPVIASNRGSIPEVAGDAALMTDVDDIEGLARNITTVLTDPEEAKRLRQRGYARAAYFSWDRTAQRYLELYERALKMPLN